MASNIVPPGVNQQSVAAATGRYWSITSDELVRSLATSATSGLVGVEAASRLVLYGANTLG
jgi:Mg2+-importing ATPase